MRIKDELQRVIDPEDDGIVIYAFDSLRYSAKDSIGNCFEDKNVV